MSASSGSDEGSQVDLVAACATHSDSCNWTDHSPICCLFAGVPQSASSESSTLTVHRVLFSTQCFGLFRVICTLVGRVHVDVQLRKSASENSWRRLNREICFLCAVDRSDEYVKHLLPQPTPTLPKSSIELDAALRSSTSIKLPVTAQCYNKVHAQSPALAQQCLLSTDGSHLPATLSTYVLKSPSSTSTELDVTLFISPALEAVFSLLEDFSGLELKAKLTFNAAESDTSSRAVSVGMRPDTLGMANSCTFLMGEDKKRKLQEGIGDLRRKKIKVSRMHYGDVHFIVGYAAAEGRFRWFWLGADQADVGNLC
jgi:hypothetical protein